MSIIGIGISLDSPRFKNIRLDKITFISSVDTHKRRKMLI